MTELSPDIAPQHPQSSAPQKPAILTTPLQLRNKIKTKSVLIYRFASNLLILSAEKTNKQNQGETCLWLVTAVVYKNTWRVD